MMRNDEPQHQTPPERQARLDDSPSALGRQQASPEQTIARLERELERARKELETLTVSRNDLAAALNATHRNLNARAHRVRLNGGGLVGWFRSLATFFLKLRNRT